jgi:hypothetical protein
MRKITLLGLFAFMVVSNSADSAAQNQDKEEKWFLKGFVESGLAFPRNEIGVNLRRPDLIEETGGFGDNFGRYVIRGHLYFGYRVNHRIIRDVFFLVKPNFIFGRNIPQIEYTWSPRYIGHAENVGVGFTLPRDWKVYFEAHKWVFQDKKAVPPDGPFELHSLLVVRKDFELTF